MSIVDRAAKTLADWAKRSRLPLEYSDAKSIADDILDCHCRPTSDDAEKLAECYRLALDEIEELTADPPTWNTGMIPRSGWCLAPQICPEPVWLIRFDGDDLDPEAEPGVLWAWHEHDDPEAIEVSAGCQLPEFRWYPVPPVEGRRE